MDLIGLASDLEQTIKDLQFPRPAANQPANPPQAARPSQQASP
jgi:hypothetical protein